MAAECVIKIIGDVPHHVFDVLDGIMNELREVNQFPVRIEIRYLSEPEARTEPRADSQSLIQRLTAVAVADGRPQQPEGHVDIDSSLGGRTLHDAFKAAFLLARSTAQERVWRLLREANVETLGQLAQLEPPYFGGSYGFGAADIEVVRELLAFHGIPLHEERLLSGQEARKIVLEGAFSHSIRLYNALKREGINTLGDLADRADEIAGFRGIGKTLLAEAEGLLVAYGLGLHQEEALPTPRAGEFQQPLKHIWPAGHHATRTCNTLKRYGVETVGQLAGMTEEEVLDMRDMGLEGLKIIKEVLRWKGLSLRGEGLQMVPGGGPEEP